MARILYGTLTSTVTLVMFILKEKDLEFERVDIDFLKGEHKTPEYMEKQPFGQVPCLDDNGFIIYECRAICQYLAMKYADRGTPNLVPPTSDVEAWARFQQAVSVETHNFYKPANIITRERVIKPFYFKMEYNQAVIDQALKEIDDKMVGYEKILSKQRYLVGDVLTLADLFHVSFGTLMIRCGWTSYQKHPNVARWWNEISSRTAWKEVYAEAEHVYDSIF
ncbi:glutathione S-transferase [Panaeolus papilionaceus]|nr:glutathione S-transferase [Panaeolus papilionaceus]